MVPAFVDAANNDFSLSATSPAIDKAVPVAGRTTDFLGDPVQGAPDIGAIERQP